VVCEAGRVLLDGVDVTRCDAASLRRRVCVLEAEPVLFRGSLRYNLRYGSFAAPEAAVLAAARRAGIERIAARLRLGYDTEVGSGGTGLSTGERQRIAIARALLCEPAVVVLDEATSNLDAAAAQAMHELIDEHFARCTRLIITHAPERVPRAARVLELREGFVLERTPPRVAHG
jgi:ATP-binding cassette subfamily B protein